MNFFGFTTGELIPYLGLLIFVVVTLVANYRRSYRDLWSPMTILAIIFFYYAIVGPLWAINTNNTFDRLQNMREHYESSFWGALVLLISCAIGFRLNQGAAPRKLVLRYNDDILRFYGLRLSIIGFVLFTISTGGNVTSLINPLDAEAVQQVGGGLGNYLGLSLNFLIPGACLLFLYYLRTKNGLVVMLVCFGVMIGIFVSLGFRYRLVLLLGALSISYFLLKHRRPNIVISIASFALLVILMGVINITRQYGQGLDTARLQQSRNESYYESGLRESLIFQTSGAVIDLVPEKHPHAGFQPLISTLLFPIPRSIYPEKNSAAYLFKALDAIYGRKFSQGSAFMAYGEYYLAFGWFGIIAGGFIVGWFSKKLWKWFLVEPDNPMRIAIYAVAVSYLYVIISRGYLPQITMLFFFTVFPIFVAYWLAKRKFGLTMLTRKSPNAN